MSKLNGRKISVARLHTATHITGVGNVGPVIEKGKLPALNRGDITLEYSDGSILIRGKKIQDAVLPAANIVSLELEPEKNSKA